MSNNDLLNGTIDLSRNADLRYERDRMLRLIQNVNLDSDKDYRSAVAALGKACDTIEKLCNNSTLQA